MKNSVPAIAVIGLIFCLRCLSQPVTGNLADARHLLPAAEIKEVRVLPQNWSDERASQFYNTTQGSQMMPYDWFLKLEQDDSTNLFRDAANMRAFGYLPRSPDQNGNPDGLPVGFVRNDKSVGLTCAACHTALIHYKGTAWLIDGGPAMSDAQTMMTKLVLALKATLTNSEKFNRFAAAVGVATNSEAGAANLKRDLQGLIDLRAAYNARNFPSEGQRSFGPGRIDAFGAIFNEVAVRFAQCPNAPTRCDAPVSYPFLWDTPQHDRVQWNGFAENTKIGPFEIGALARNIGEVLGVFADVDTTEMRFPLRGYASSVNTAKLVDLENWLRDLWSPQWPDAFGKIDSDLAKKGEVLFQENCARCHQDINRSDPNRTVTAVMRDMGTDESMARNAAERKSDSGIFKGRRLWLPPFSRLGTNEPVLNLLVFLGQRVLAGSHLISDSIALPFKYDVFAEIKDGQDKVSMKLDALKVAEGKLETATVKEFSILTKGIPPVLHPGSDLADIPNNLSQIFSNAPGDEADETSTLTPTAGTAAPISYPYKARPLNGIWATAPYLHNGSVLNLDDLLKPAGDRLKTFRLGSREFDPVNVGYVNAGEFIFDTTAVPANSNAGHEYNGKVFTPEERSQIIEYMKSL